MQALDPIEATLARLMPPALSESATRSIEAMLDELAAAAAPQNESAAVQRSSARWLLPLGVAACFAALIALVPVAGPASGPLAMTRTATTPHSGLVLVGESDRIEAMSDEGWMEDPDGAAMQAVRVRVVEANTLRDEETGIVVQVSEPREEMVLTPVSVF
jgi:hypothetical protein